MSLRTDGKRVDSTFIFGHWDTFQLLHEVLPQVQLQKLAHFYILYEQQFHLTLISASRSQWHQAKSNAANNVWGHP